MKGKIRIAVVESHPLWRKGIAATLAAHEKFHIVGQGENANDALQLAAGLLPDILLLDVDIPGCGLSVAGQVSSVYPAIQIVMLSISQDESKAYAALRAGARGYILKGISGVELVHILARVHAGETYITPSLACSPLFQFREFSADAATIRD